MIEQKTPTGNTRRAFWCIREKGTKVEARSEVFQIAARRCRRCGGILTSAQGLRDGYGPCCLRKAREEEAQRREEEKLVNLFDLAAEGGKAWP